MSGSFGHVLEHGETGSLGVWVESPHKQSREVRGFQAFGLVVPLIGLGSPSTFIIEVLRIVLAAIVLACHW